MVSASATFNIGTPSSSTSLQPSLGTLNTSPYPAPPTYATSTAPPAGPGEAAITNVSMPRTVLPGASFQIVCTVATYVYGSINYTVTLTIPQLNISVISNVLNLSNDAVGTTNFTVNIPAITSTGIYTGTLTLQDTTNSAAVASVPITFQVIGGLQPGGPNVGLQHSVIPGGPISAPPPQARAYYGRYGYQVTTVQPYGYQQGDIYGDIDQLGSNTLPSYVVPQPTTAKKAYQGYVFGQRSGHQRHQWDFMPHSFPVSYGYQGLLGGGNVYDPTPAPPPQAVVVAPPPTVVTTPAPVITTPAPLVPTTTDTGLPPTPVITPVVTTPSPVVTTPSPVVTTPTPVVTTPSPVVTTPTPVVTTPTPVVTTTPTHNPQDWRNWDQRFRQQQQWQNRFHRRHQQGWQHQMGRRAYQAQIQQPAGAPFTVSQQPTPAQTPQQAVILTTVLPNGTLHLDAHGFTANEPVTLDLNIPMSKVSKSTNLTADATGHLAHDYNLKKPVGKQYIAALRVTGHTSNRVGFKTVNI